MLFEITGHTYRLPTSAEWEYPAQAGTKPLYWWGTESSDDKAVTAYDLSFKFLFWRLKKERYPYLRIVATRDPNPFGYRICSLTCRNGRRIEIMSLMRVHQRMVSVACCFCLKVG
ncbi:MAG: SUMF1/EgtB/PvdO family nonheme iron enzyme [Methylocystaceae bacterium]|nr:SUMF1/EgtB/PvdO family nonheme iron enzyme [Methylocystaceae bacterium]